MKVKCVYCGHVYLGCVCNICKQPSVHFAALLRDVKRGSEDRPLESIKEEGK
jgi:hypothetical protein